MATREPVGRSARPRPQREVAPEPEAEHVNEVRLVGRVSMEPEERTLPSGDVVFVFRVVVPRSTARGRSSTGAARVQVDALDCAAWTRRVQRVVAGVHVGDLVDVTGEVRRRFFRTGGGPVSRVEIEVGRARVIRRATT